MLKKIFIICLTFILSFAGFAQTEADLQTPRIVPPSADAAALGKYGEIPVDKSTGVPDISIPLYNIKTPRFTLPISLSYHASGIKVEEIASWVGAGWVLNAGGLITRTMIGYGDDGGMGFLTNRGQIKSASNINWPNDILYISNVVNKKLDTDPDNFFFNFNQHSGSFVFGLDGNPVLTPYQPINITYDFTPSVGYISDFTIIDEGGNFYNFSTRENVTSSISNELSGISSWYLTQMVSADLSDTIKFLYTTDASAQVEFSHNFSQDISDLCNNGVTTLRSHVETLSSRTFYPVRISSIVFKGGKIDFSSSTGRLDDGNTSLDSVKVYNLNYASNQYSLIKSFKLLKDYFYSTIQNPTNLTPTERNKHRLILTGIQEIDKNNTVADNYKFDYNSTMLPPTFSYAQDKWGYYNGQNGNQTLLEAKQITYSPTVNSSPVSATLGDGEGANRSVSATNMEAGVLQEITYPTGGYTTFDYDCNKMLATTYNTTTLNVTAIGANNSGGSQEINTQFYTPTTEMLQFGGNIFTIDISKGDNPTSSPLPYVQITRVSDGSVIYTNAATESLNVETTVGLNLQAGTQYQIESVADGNDSQPSSSSPYAIVAVTYKVSSGTAITDMGGLRVSSINNYDVNGTVAKTETYTYGINDESGAGVQLSVLSADNFARPTVCASSPVYPDLNTTFSFTNTYSDNSFYPLETLNGSPVGYPTVTVYNGDQTQNIGKTVYQYQIFQDSIFTFTPGNVIKPIPVTWKNGDPIGISTYRNNGNNQYSLISSESMQYSIIGKTGGMGTVIQFAPEPIGQYSDCDFFGDPVIDNSSGHPLVYSGGGFCQWFPNWFIWYDYPISSGIRVLSQTSKADYAPDGVTAVQNITNYYYDNPAHYFPTRIVTYDSKGETITTYKKYPQDYTITGTPNNNTATGIQNLQNLHMINPVIEQYEQLSNSDGTNLRTVGSIFSTYKPTIPPLPDITYSTEISQPLTSFSPTIITSSGVTMNSYYKPQIYFDSYDGYSNIIQLHKTNGIFYSYIWDYGSSFPIAKVSNASQADIAYTSFEANGKGNWTFSGTPDNSNGAITGTQSYFLSYGAISKPGLTSATKYIISYWSKGSVSVSGGTQSNSITGKTVNGWTYHELMVTGTTSISISGSTYIDELRLYPSYAQMTTYTYEPLKGMTSQCDVDNVIQYYDYDSLGRLLDIKDCDGNIIKTFQYHYQSSPQ